MPTEIEKYVTKICSLQIGNELNYEVFGQLRQISLYSTINFEVASTARSPLG